MKYEVGMKIKIYQVEDGFDYSGYEGVITHIDEMGRLFGTWGPIGLIPELDLFKVVEEE